MGFLLGNWKLIAIGLAVAAVAVYIGILKMEVSHYKDAYAQDELVIAKYIAKEKALVEENKRITEAHAETLKRYKAEIDKNTKSTLEKIALNEELKRTRITLDAVRLFNESKRGPKDTTTPEPGNDGSTDGAGTVSLADIFAQVAKNDAKHLACVAQVKEWQGFWKEYSGAVAGVNGPDNRMRLEQLGAVRWKD